MPGISSKTAGQATRQENTAQAEEGRDQVAWSAQPRSDAAVAVRGESTAEVSCWSSCHPRKSHLLCQSACVTVTKIPDLGCLEEDSQRGSRFQRLSPWLASSMALSPGEAAHHGTRSRREKLRSPMGTGDRERKPGRGHREDGLPGQPPVTPSSAQPRLPAVTAVSPFKLRQAGQVEARTGQSPHLPH